MSIISAASFAEFFTAMYGYAPFPWQQRLAAQVAAGQWPTCLALPTASGKTACIDIALFALACQAHLSPEDRRAPRRIFFVVDRRVIVDEAYRRAQRLADELANARTGILAQVATALRRVARVPEGSPPLDAYQLRGGVYRDDAWVRGPLQPTVIASTVDQVGSRLLFRGYGVSDNARPIHAALIANDSLIVLDEAHCAQPFRETLAAVQRYRGDAWSESPMRTPFQFVEMSATPRDGSAAFRLDADDDRNRVLADRRNARKPAKLVVAPQAKGKQTIPKLVGELHKQATHMANSEAAPQAIAIIVNRVRTARELHARLVVEHGDHAHLVIGRMRPIDRDALTEDLQRLFASGVDRDGLDDAHFVVATQCLEVGADFDFDAMVCECASLDALRQRFGRLNRLGRPIETRAAVVIAEADITADEKHPDPVYGTALAATWQWLNAHADPSASDADAPVIDMGIEALATLLPAAPEALATLLAPAPHAPVMLPAHLDRWCQTSPVPVPDPEVSLFLHGPETGQPEVQICWRADLATEPDADAWTQAVSLCPPVSAECLAAPLWLARQWLIGSANTDIYTDVLSARLQDDEPSQRGVRPALVWRGPDCSVLVTDPAHDLRPGDTLVLPAQGGGWSTFGHLPGAPSDPAETAGEQTTSPATVDKAHDAFRERHDKAILRLHPAVWPTDPALAELREWAADPEDDRCLDDLRALLKQAATALPPDRQRLAATLEDLGNPANGLIVQAYPDYGAVLTSRQRLDLQARVPIAFDDGDDSSSITDHDRPVPLSEHLGAVGRWAQRYAADLGSNLAAAVALAARTHDLGKADPRFQSYLVNRPLPDGRLWAKHPNAPETFAEHRRARAASGLPPGYRHELLSVALLASRLADDLPCRDLVLHLLATHHGYCRPFAPVVEDPQPKNVHVSPTGETPDCDTVLKSSTATGLERLDAGVPERFWQLVRQHGWWGLPYLETIVRLADWRRSADESRGVPPPAPWPWDPRWLAPPPVPPPQAALLLRGLDGANPLAFLAALGALRLLHRAWPDRHVRISWQQHDVAWRPVIHAHGQLDPDEVVEALMAAGTPPEHPALTLDDNLNVPPEVFLEFVSLAAADLHTDGHDRTWVDFAAAFGCETIVSETSTKPAIADTALRTMSGAGHQHFLKFCRDIIAATEATHIHKSLFHPWDYSDPGRGLMLRWDPGDDRRYALRFDNPSTDPAVTMRGANRLALEALPMLPTMPTARGLGTTAFRGRGSRDTFFLWPLWRPPLDLAACTSLLAHPAIVAQPEPPSRADLERVGVCAVCQSQRITTGKFRNFAPAHML